MPPKRAIPSDTMVRILSEAFGKAKRDVTVSKLAGGSNADVRKVYPTGIDVLDHHVLGVGGLPAGRVLEVYSQESVGKTSLGHAFLGAAQRAGGVGVLVETEHALDSSRPAVFGVDPETLVLMQPETLEDALIVCGMAAEAIPDSVKGPRVIVWDSVAATPTRKEVEAGLDGHEAMGERARAMSFGMRVLCPILSRTETVLVALNQTRARLGVLYGDPETTPGGAALKFHASARLRLSPGKAVKGAEGHTGKYVRCTAVKNKLATPFRTCDLLLDFASGWNSTWATLEYAKDLKLVGPLARGRKGLLKALEGLAALPTEPTWAHALEAARAESPPNTDEGDEG